MHKHRWDDLQFLNAVAEHGSLSAASRALGVNHSTVLRRVVYLEKSNEVQIFDRESVGYKIRPEGRILLGSLKLMQQAADRIERNLALMRKGISGTFRLSTTDSIANILLPTYLLNLREVYPHIRIEVEVSNKRVQMKNPNSEILIRAGAPPEPELHGEKVGVISFGIFGTMNYLKNNPDSEIESHNWLGVKPEFAKTVADGWQISTVGDQVGFSADSFLTIASMAEHGLGLAMLPIFVGRKSKKLIQASQFSNGPIADLWVATHKEYKDQIHIKSILDFFVEAIKADIRT